jgi:hypothetical protein
MPVGTPHTRELEHSRFLSLVQSSKKKNNFRD